MKFNLYLFAFLITLLTSCVSSESALNSTPEFVTAILPATPAPQPSPTSEPPTSAASPIAPTLSAPVEGTTTSEVNVRIQPSTASTSLGTITIFSKVQITGQDESGSWYQIIHAAAPAWIRAKYVQVSNIDAIPHISTAAHLDKGISGLAAQKINVRKGPGTNFESLGMLSPNDIVFAIGKDPGGTWAQIEFASARDGKGWAAIEFLKMNNADTLPIINSTEQTAPAPINTEITEKFPATLQDGDSKQAPLGRIVFSPASAQSFQVNGGISSSNGDTEDWLQFVSYSPTVLIQILCLNDGLYVELWKEETSVDNFLIACGDKKLITVTPNSTYLLRLSEPDTNKFQHTEYVLNMESVR